MLSRLAEAHAERILETALAEEGGRVFLFRQLAAYEASESFEAWCARWNHRQDDENAHVWWSNLHVTYMVAWRVLGWDTFQLYLRLSRNNLHRSGQ